MRANRFMPQDALIPVLGYPDVAQAVDWLCAAFGFDLRWQIDDHRAQLAAGSGAIAVHKVASALRQTTQNERDASPNDYVMVRVADADSHCERARAHGAQIVDEPSDHQYGERQYSALDFAGRRWVFSESIADVAPADWGAITPTR